MGSLELIGSTQRQAVNHFPFKNVLVVKIFSCPKGKSTTYVIWYLAPNVFQASFNEGESRDVTGLLNRLSRRDGCLFVESLTHLPPVSGLFCCWRAFFVFHSKAVLVRPEAGKGRTLACASWN